MLGTYLQCGGGGRDMDRQVYICDRGPKASALLPKQSRVWHFGEDGRGCLGDRSHCSRGRVCWCTEEEDEDDDSEARRRRATARHRVVSPNTSSGQSQRRAAPTPSTSASVDDAEMQNHQPGDHVTHEVGILRRTERLRKTYWQGRLRLPSIFSKIEKLPWRN